MARALISLGWVALRRGDLEGASSLLGEAIPLTEDIGDPHLLARALRNLGAVRSDQQRNEEAVSLYERSAEIAETMGDKRSVMMALLGVGELAMFARHCGEARETLLRVVAFAQEFHDPFHEAAALTNLGIIDMLQGRPMSGIAALRRALDLARDIGSMYLALASVDGLAAAMANNHPSKAARLFVASDALREREGLPRSASEQELYDSYIRTVVVKLTPEERARVCREVQGLNDLTALAQGDNEVLD